MSRRLNRYGACLLIVLGVAGLFAGKAKAAVIELVERTQVSGTLVQLGDVAHIHADELTRTRLTRVALVPVPIGGRPLNLDLDTIRTRLLAQGFALADLEFTGSSVVQVVATPEPPAGRPQSALRPVPSTPRVVQAVAQELARRLLSERIVSGPVTIQFSPADISAGPWPAAGESWTVNDVTSTAGRLNCVLRWTDRQGQALHRPLPFTLTVWPIVVVAKSAVAKGDVLTGDNLAREPYDPAQLPPGALRQRDELIGQEVRRALRPGDPVLTGDVRSLPLVRRGEIISVLARAPGITVRMEVRAQADGALNDTIPVHSLDGKQKLLARVVGYHLAQVPAGEDSAPGGPPGGLRVISGP